MSGKATCIGTRWILFNLKKGLTSGTCYNMDEPGKTYAKWNKPGTKKTNIVWFQLIWGT